jgi:ATP-binding cassette subfamily B protein
LWELGLGELLQRMLQMVGETGWQLSHGERSHLYIVHALLQRALAAPFVVGG